MVDQLNEGVSFLNYRGFYGFSNFDEQDINQLNNGFMLPQPHFSKYQSQNHQLDPHNQQE